MFYSHKYFRDLNAKDAERLFLEEASKLQTYGVEPIPVKVIFVMKNYNNHELCFLNLF